MKKQILVLLFALAAFTVSAVGDSCSIAIPMPLSINSSINGNTLNGGLRWFAFIPLTSEVQIKLTNTSPSGGHIHDLVLLEGVCNPKFFIVGSDSRNDSVLKIQIHNLIPGLPYHILVMRERTTCPKCIASGATFNLNVKSLPAPIETSLNNVVYLNGKPSHVKGEVVLRINKLYLKMNAVNNVSIQSGPLSTFIQNGATIQGLVNIILGTTEDPTGSKGIQIRKFYPKLTANDTISLTRQGEQIRIPDFWETFILSIPDTMKVPLISRILSDINGIRYAEPNFILKSTSVPNDPFYASFQSNLHPTSAWANANINVEGAWDMETGKSFVRVGVYDTGIDQTHSDLNNGKVVDGYDYKSNAALSSPYDTDGHGTSCAGIIAAFRNNNNNIAGIAGGDATINNSGCSLVDMKIASSVSSFATLNTISNAIVGGALSTPAGYGLHVMSNSWVSEQNSASLRNAVQTAVQNGVTFVSSRGNYPDITPMDKPTYPACLQDEMVINVGASGSNGEWKTSGNGNVSDPNDNNFSSMIKLNVDLIAPGTSTVVRTTDIGNSFHGFNGTSAAAPHVSGVAALMHSYYDQPTPSLSNLAIEDVENILQMSANDKSASPASSGLDDYSGWGLLNATAAMNLIKTPNFKIQHFGVNQNATSSKVQTKIATHAQVVLLVAFQSLAAGVYYADIYEETITLNYNLSSPNDQIVSFWPRFSSTTGWSAANPQGTDNFCQIISVTNNQAILKTWSYNFLYDQNGNLIVDPWYPTQYDQKAALSIYTKDKSIVGLKDYNKDESELFSIFPNPANNNIFVNISLLKSQSVSLEIYDSQGKMVESINQGKLPEGKNNFNIPLANLADGIYMCKMITEETIVSKKLVVIK